MLMLERVKESDSLLGSGVGHCKDFTCCEKILGRAPKVLRTLCSSKMNLWLLFFSVLSHLLFLFWCKLFWRAIHDPMYSAFLVACSHLTLFFLFYSSSDRNRNGSVFTVTVLDGIQFHSHFQRGTADLELASTLYTLEGKSSSYSEENFFKVSSMTMK